MKNVKKIIASSLMALTMVGAVAAPTIRDFTTKPVTASAYYHQQNIYTTFRVKANSVFRTGPGFKYSVKCSIGNWTSTIYTTKVQVNSDGTWYYSRYDNAWINKTRLY